MGALCVTTWIKALPNFEVLFSCDRPLIAFPFCLLITFSTLSDFVKNSGTPRCSSENQALQALMGGLEVGSLDLLEMVLWSERSLLTASLLVRG